MVNVVNGANTQAQAVVGAEGATQLSGLVDDLNKTQTKEAVKKPEIMEKLLESGGSKELTTQLLKDLMSKVSQAGISLDQLAPKTKVENKKSDRRESDVSEGEGTDRVQLSAEKDPNLPVQGIAQSKTKLGNSEREINNKWEEMKEELVKQGKSNEEISRQEAQFKASETKKYIFDLLKDNVIMYYLDSDTSTRELIRRSGFPEVLDKVGEETVREATQQATSELKSFIIHEMENQMILRTFLQDNDFKEAYKLVKVGNKIGLDSMSWLEKVWPQKKENHGLNILDVPHEITGFVNLKDYEHDSRQRKAKEQFEYKEDDEKDVMLNRLRAQYLQLALRPGAMTSVQTWFKIRSLKNGIQRLGVFTKDMDEKVQEEAKTLAKIRTMEVLDEALLENASVFDPSKENALQGKIKNCLKNLDRLGFKLEDKDFAALRDKANEQMYGLVEKEMDQTKTKKGPAAEQRMQQLQKLAVRLQKESNLSFKEEA